MVLRYEVRDDGVGIITIENYEKRNALSLNFYEQLIAALKELKRVKLLLIRGSNGIFSSGIDLQDLMGHAKHTSTADESFDELEDYILVLQKAMVNLYNFKGVTIAAVEGHCLGAGMELALACDFIASKEDTIFSLPEVSFGIIPDLGGISRLRDRVGMHITKKYVLTGAKFTGKEAFEQGIVTWLLSDLKDSLNSILDNLKNYPRETLVKAKQLIQGNSNLDSERWEQLNLFGKGVPQKQMKKMMDRKE